MVASFARIARSNPFAFPGRAPQLNVRHPAAVGDRVLGQGLRLAAVCCPNGGVGNNRVAFLDLASNKTSAWLGGTGGQLINTDIGPCSIPNAGSNGPGPLFPALFASEVQVYGITLAVICQVRNTVTGSGLINIDSVSSGTKIEIGIQPSIRFMWSGGSNFAVGSFQWPTLNVVGRSYFAVASYRCTGVAGFNNPRSSGVLVDLTTGQTWLGTNGTAMTASTLANSGPASYSVCTYGPTGTPDLTRLAAAAISMNYLSQEQLFAWAKDPWSLWYAPQSTLGSRMVPAVLASSSNAPALMIGA